MFVISTINYLHKLTLEQNYCPSDQIWPGQEFIENDGQTFIIILVPFAQICNAAHWWNNHSCSCTKYFISIK